MALVGHISGSIQTNSAIGVTGSVVISDKPSLTFPSLDSGIKFLVDEASLFKSTVVSSGSVTVKNSVGSPSFAVVASSGDTTVGGTFSSVGAATFQSGLSGSLTRLTNGTSAFIAGSGMTITTGSNGAVTFASTGAPPGGLDTQVQFNNAGSLDGHDGLTYVSATRSLSAHTLSVTGSGGLAVLQTATINGVANLNGGIAVDTAAFTVADTTGNISTAGTLSVAQSITGSSTLTLAGQAILNGGIISDGGVFQVADTTGNISTAGTLSALQSITGSSTLTLAGQAILNGGIISDAGVFQVADATGNISTAGTLSVLQSITGSSTLTMNGTAIFNADVDLGDAITDTITFTGRVDSDVLPISDSTYNLGSSTRRWANVFTGDLHLRNDRGDYTLIEEEEMLTIRFNKTGKRYKFLLEAVPHLDEEPEFKF